MSDFLTTPEFPYCKGCGHHLVARNTARALEALPSVRPLDVVLVTDIGCHGIVDNAFATHTVHGLHGRSVALGTGIALGLSKPPVAPAGGSALRSLPTKEGQSSGRDADCGPLGASDLPAGKKVIVYLGDGGATIGLQHILEAARLNPNVTVVVHNNMLYGMTGGQPSGLTPCGFRTNITPEGHTLAHHDLCRLVRDAGAPYVARVVGLGDYSETLRDALATDGFALVEVLELCIAYGAKLNPDLRLRELAQQAGYEPGVWTGDARPAFRLPRREGRPDLLAMKEVSVRFASPLPSGGRMAILLSGSAGEGVQQAAELFARAAMACGLSVTKKGSYPVTVGVGFSTAEIILSRDPIEYHGVARPDAVLVTSEDGLRHSLGRIRGMDGGMVWLDESLTAPQTGAEVRVRDFRERAGPRNAAIYALLTFARETGVIPAEALVETIQASSIGKHVPAELLEGAAST